MAFGDNIYVQIAFAILIFYVVTQLIQQPKASEYLDADSTNIVVGQPVAATASAGAINPVPENRKDDAPLSGVQPLSALAEPILAQAPAGSDVKPLTIAPADLDDLFTNQDELDPSELIPKYVPSDIYGDIKPDPSLNQNFLQNPYQLGIQTQAPKRNYVHDLRGAPPNPISVVTPFLQGTIMPDIQRRVLDISEQA
jgi:hypothetical protein